MNNEKNKFKIDPLLQVLCAINNRLTDIAATLQTIGMYLCPNEAGRQECQELLQGQRDTYATIEIRGT